MRVIMERSLYARELGVIVYYSSLENIIIFFYSKSDSMANYLNNQQSLILRSLFLFVSSSIRPFDPIIVEDRPPRLGLLPTANFMSPDGNRNHSKTTFHQTSPTSLPHHLIVSSGSSALGSGLQIETSGCQRI